MRGFTLIELVVVLAILATLAAVITPMLAPHAGEAKREAWNFDRRLIQNAADSYQVIEATLPVTGADLVDFPELIEEEYLYEMPESAENSYTWFFEPNDRVQSYLTSDSEIEGYAGVFP